MTALFVGIAVLQLIVAVSSYFRILGTRSEQSVALYAFDRGGHPGASEVLRVTYDHTARAVVEPEALDVESDGLVGSRTLDLRSGPVEILRFDASAEEHEVRVSDGPRALTTTFTMPVGPGGAMAMDAPEVQGPTVHMMDGTSRAEGVTTHRRERCDDDALELFVIPAGGSMRRLERHALNFHLFSGEAPVADRQLRIAWHDTFGEHETSLRTNRSGQAAYSLEAAAFVSVNVSTACPGGGQAAWTADVVSHSVTTAATPEQWVVDEEASLRVDVANPYVSGALWWRVLCDGGSQALGGANTARGAAEISVHIPPLVSSPSGAEPAACELSIYRGGDYTNPPMATALIWVSGAGEAAAADALDVASERLGRSCDSSAAHCVAADFAARLRASHGQGSMAGAVALSRLSEAYPFRRVSPQQVLSTREELESLASERRSARLRAYHLFFAVELVLLIVAIVAFVVARSRRDSLLEAELEAELGTPMGLELTDRGRVFWYWVQAAAVLGLALLGALFLAWLGIGGGL